MRIRVSPMLRVACAASAACAVLGAIASGAAGAATQGAKSFAPSGGALLPTATNCIPSDPPVPSDDCAMAGYQASGRDFRYAQAVITVPDHTGVVSTGVSAPRRPSADGTPSEEVDPQIYVALDDSSSASYQFARVGIEPCTGESPCGTSGWQAFAQVMSATSPPGEPVVLFPITAAEEGDGVFVSVYLEPTDQSVHTVITLPDGSTFNNDFAVTGPVYTKAQALADWTTAFAKPQPVPPTAKLRDTQFFQGRFTTLNGQRGTFAGPWSLNAFEGTSNGALPPAGTLVAQPSYLWNDGSGFHGLGDDAFGVWRFPS